VAVKRVIEERVRTERQAPSGAPVQGSLGEYIRCEFLPVKEHDWSQRGEERATWRASARRIALEIADSDLGRLPFTGVQRRDVKRWWAGHKGRVDGGQWSRETANKRLTMLRAIYNHAVDDEHPGLVANPTVRIKKFRIDPTTLPTEHFASDAERERVIEAARPNPRLHAAVLLATFYGLRRASVCELRVRDLDLQGETLTWTTKTGQRIMRPLHPRLREPLADLAGGRAPDDSLLGYGDYHSLTTAFRRLVQRVGLGRRFRFHGLRHDFGTRILKKTGNLRVAQEALGHSRITQTERYTHVLAEEVNAAILAP
jgi:integrase